LLKTLEEPPAHVKFLFATTEADKLPVTVLSRCQRFDLRRIPTPMLAEHFAGICVKEQVAADGEALAMIAAAAEGSVRDGLSILDQAIAHADLDAEGKVTAEQVRDMLGLADKSIQRRLFAALLGGDGGGLLDLVATQFSLGVEPLALLRGAMDLTHRITVAQIGGANGPGAADAVSAEEREAIEGWAKALAAGQLHRLWQLLLKGFDEVRTAPDPLVAAQMALLRVMHAADMPDPGQLARKLEELASRPAPTAPAAPGDGASVPAAPVGLPWEALVKQVETAGKYGVADTMRMQVRVVELAPGLLRYSQPPGLNEDIAALLKSGLQDVTRQPGQVERVTGQGAPTLVELSEAATASSEAAVRKSPLVEAVFSAFPEAEFITESEQAAEFRGNRKWSQKR
jgi:DNA polymerase-3 subunit gamma/tau